MNQLNSVNDTYADERRALSRRTALRTALWSAPVVSVAAAAPAFAASGGNGWATLNVASAEWRLQGVERWIEVGRGLDLGIRIRTTDGSAPIRAGQLSVTVTFPYQLVRSDLDTRDRNIVVKSVSSGWVATAPQYFGSGTGRYATVRFTYQKMLLSGTGLLDGTTPLSFDAQRDTTTQHLSWRDVKLLPFTFQAIGFSRTGAGVIGVRT